MSWNSLRQSNWQLIFSIYKMAVQKPTKTYLYWQWLFKLFQAFQILTLLTIFWLSHESIFHIFQTPHKG